MSAPERKLELNHLQTLTVYGYKHDHCRYFILTIAEAQRAREFLKALARDHWVEAADRRAKGGDGHDTPVSVGLTYQGLRLLGLRERFLDLLRMRAPAFYEGAHARAAAHLADTGVSSSRYWDPRYATATAHVVLAVYGATHAKLDEAERALRKLAAGAFATEGWNQAIEGCHLNEKRGSVERRTVHFGFVDGISKVLIKGVARRDAHEERSDTRHEPGEFFLGYANDKGFNPWLLGLEPPEYASPIRHPGQAGVSDAVSPPVAPADFFRNGSFAAFRDMHQDEEAFRGYTAARAEKLGVSADYLRAKMLGRWPDGQVVRPGETHAPPASTKKTADLDGFDFSDDAQGLGCPFGAHVRRMNPRADGVVPFRRRPLIRRGIAYGAAYASGEEPGKKRGLLGLFLCASLEDQFEHLLSQWGDANPMGTPNKGNSKDPIIGNHMDGRPFFDIPMPDASSRRLDGLQPFITTRGTLYLFFPGLNALQMMGNDHVFPPHEPASTADASHGTG